MTYKGKKIGVPTLEMIKEHIERRHIAADPEWVYNHYKDRHWKNAKGRPFRSLEIMIGGGANYFMHDRKPKPLYISPYEEQLKDYRWKAFRDFVFVARGKQCEMCGNKTYLQIHHPKYIHGRRAWEYNCNEVRVLCREQHIFHSYFGIVDIDTLQYAFNDFYDKEPCYIIHTDIVDRDTINYYLYPWKGIHYKDEYDSLGKKGIVQWEPNINIKYDNSWFHYIK